MTEQELDELNKPRIICLCDYPDNHFPINEIIPLVWDEKKRSYKHIKFDGSGEILSSHFTIKYKKIFKEFKWYEKREIKEMPEYVRWLDGKSYKVIEHDFSCDNHQGYGEFVRCKIEGHKDEFLQYANCLPTNKEGYIPKI